MLPLKSWEATVLTGEIQGKLLWNRRNKTMELNGEISTD
jgi:hypothetical protein